VVELGSNLFSLHFNQLIPNLNEIYFSIFQNVKIKDLTPITAQKIKCLKNRPDPMTNAYFLQLKERFHL